MNLTGVFSSDDPWEGFMSDYNYLLFIHFTRIGINYLIRQAVIDRIDLLIQLPSISDRALIFSYRTTSGGGQMFAHQRISEIFKEKQ